MGRGLAPLAASPAPGWKMGAWSRGTGVRRRARTEESARRSPVHVKGHRDETHERNLQPARRNGRRRRAGEGAWLRSRAPPGSCPGGGGPHWGPMSQQPAMH